MNAQYLELDEGVQGMRPQAPFARNLAWRADDISASDWTVDIAQDALNEIQAVLGLIRRQQLPVYLLSSDDFELDSCRTMMQQVRDKLDGGIGNALLNRLPIEDWTADETRAVYWLLGQLLSKPVAQESNGLIFRDIRDEGGGQKFGNEAAVTNNTLTFHNDNSGNRTRPNYVGLMCINAAQQGGLSQYCSVYSIYNALASNAPEQLERLFHAFFHDRQNIQTPGEVELIRAPVFSYDGDKLHGRFSLNKITIGYRKAGVSIDNETQSALTAVIEAIENEKLACSFMIRPGQIQYLNNLEGLHHRSDYSDGHEPHQRRHMLRMWYRNEGRAFFDG